MGSARESHGKPFPSERRQGSSKRLFVRKFGSHFAS